MKHFLIFLVIIGIFAISITITPSLSPTGFTVAENTDNDINESEIPNFRLYTKAICNNVSDFIVCHDELFASCGNLEYMLPKNEVNGNGIFNKDWKDPREQ